MRKNISIALIFFFLGGAYMYFDSKDYYQRKRDEDKKLYEQTIEIYRKSLDISKQITYNCGSAYTTATDCFVNLNACDMPKEKSKLMSLDLEKQRLRSELDEMEGTLHNAKN